MSFELFIAKRIYADKAEDGERFSRPAIRIAMLGVAIGVAVMLVSLAVVLGFKHEVSSKVIGFGSHIQVLSLTQNQNYEMLPVLTNDTLIRKVKKVQGVGHIQKFATKIGILKTEENFRGLTFKGVGEDYDLSFFQNSLKEGKMPKFSAKEGSNEILLSEKVAGDLGVKVGDKIFAYFMGEESMRARRFKVAGVFATNMNDYDRNYVITDIYTVRKLNSWDEEMSSGLEVTVNDFDKVDELTQRLQFIHQGTDRNGVTYGVFSIKDIAGHTFAWLSVLDMNVLMILVLMIAFALAPKALKKYAEVNGALVVKSIAQSFVRLVCWCVQLALVLWALGAVSLQPSAFSLLFVYYLLVTITPNVPIAEIGVRGAWAILVFGTMNAAMAGVLLWIINTLWPCVVWVFLKKNAK